jgi:hypothetical protein
LLTPPQTPFATHSFSTLPNLKVFADKWLPAFAFRPAGHLIGGRWFVVLQVILEKWRFYIPLLIIGTFLPNHPLFLKHPLQIAFKKCCRVFEVLFGIGFCPGYGGKGFI